VLVLEKKNLFQRSRVGLGPHENIEVLLNESSSETDSHNDSIDLSSDGFPFESNGDIETGPNYDADFTSYREFEEDSLASVSVPSDFTISSMENENEEDDRLVDSVTNSRKPSTSSRP